MQTDLPSISIVIVAYRAHEALRSTLTSVFEHTAARSFEVIVVDNGADVAGARSVVECFPAAYLPTSNRGFAAAANLGLGRSRAPIVALLNPDVVLHDDALGALAALLAGDPTIGCAGPRLLKPDGTPQPYAFGREPRPWFLVRRGLERIAGRLDRTEATAADATMPIDVDWVAGTCLVIRGAAFASAGPLDERFFLYWEDADWCLRAKRFGWRVVFDPRVTITHLGGASMGATAAHHYYRSLVRFYRKWYGWPAALGLNLALKLYAPIAVSVRRLRAHRH